MGRQARYRSYIGPYFKNRNNPKSIKLRQQRIAMYQNRLTELSHKLSHLGSEVIYITPSIYDQTMTGGAYNYLGVNDALSKCSEFIKNKINLDFTIRN